MLMEKEAKRPNITRFVERFESSEPHDCFNSAREYIDNNPGRYRIFSSSDIPSQPGQIIFYSEIYRD